MNEKHPIDDLFQSKLENSGLPYSSDYWAGAESVIVSAKKPAAKRRTLIYLIGFLVLISVSLLTLIIKSDSKSAKQAKTTPSEKETEYRTNQRAIDNSTELSQDQLGETKVENNETIATEFPRQAAPKNQTKPNHSFISSKKSSPFTDKRAAATAQGASLVSSYSPFSMIQIAPKWLLQFELYHHIDSNPMFRLDEKTFIQHKNSKWSWFLSPQYSFGIFDKTGEGLTSNEVQWKADPKICTTYGLNVLAKHGHWGFKTGIIHQTLNERVNYSKSVEEWNFDTSANYSIYGYTITPRGTKVAYLRRNVDSTQSIHNEPICDNCLIQFKYISIPLLVQYEWTKKRNIFFVESGISYHMLQQSVGTYLIEDASQPKGFEEVDLSSSNYLNSSLFWIHLNIGAKYRLNSKLNAFGSIGLSQSTNSLLSTNAQKANVKNINLGLEYRLK
jgi:hypothetical protein